MRRAANMSAAAYIRADISNCSDPPGRARCYAGAYLSAAAYIRADASKCSDTPGRPRAALVRTCQRLRTFCVHDYILTHKS